jgi:hypothetical protein
MARSASAELPHFPLGATLAERVGLRPLVDKAAPVAPRTPSVLERARAEAAAESEARLARLRAEDRAEFDRQLAERDRQHNETTAARLAERLEAGLAAIEARLSAEVARVLARFLSGAVRERALGELAETVAALTRNRGGVAIVGVSGPPALLEALSARLGRDGLAAVATEGGDPDIVVRLDDTVIASRIAAWGERIESAIGESVHV